MRLLTQLKTEMFRIVTDPRSSAMAKIEAAKVIAACAGILLPDTSEAFLSTRQAIELRQARKAVADRMLKRKERRKLENRRQYLKRKIKAAETAQASVTDTAAMKGKQ